MQRAQSRGFGVVEVAIVISLSGIVLAVAIPAFMRQLHGSRFAEPVEGLQRLGTAALMYAQERPATDAFPANAPMTPQTPPRGTREIDPPGIWDHPTWQALHFRAVPEGEAHAFSFAFDSARSPGRSVFVAHAHGDLNGNGITSTFEVRGHALAEESQPVLEPGMFVEAEVE